MYAYFFVCDVCYYALQTLSLRYIIIAAMKFVNRIEESERLSKDILLPMDVIGLMRQE